MSNPHYHALSSVRKFSKEFPECTYDYAVKIHTFFDSSKAAYANIHHRSILHHDFGTYCAKKIFGYTPLNDLICQQHLIEDTSIEPKVDDWWDTFKYKKIRNVLTQEIDEYMAKKFGGKPEDYNEINSFMDMPKKFSNNDFVEYITHNSFGCYLAEAVFGVNFTRKSDGAVRPTRLVAEEHCNFQTGKIHSLHEVLHDNLVVNKKWQILGPQKLSQVF